MRGRIALSQGIQEPHIQRAVRALESAIVQALDTIDGLSETVDGLEAADVSGAVPTTRTISTTAPLTGGGDLSANRTLAVSTFGAGASGVVPSSGGGTVNFLRADGTWAAPPAGGETNTASNAGSGAGVWKTKTGVDLVFRSLLSTTGDLVITEATDEVTFAVNPADGGLFGDASDGDATIAVNTTLARDMFYDNLTVDVGVVLNTGGFRIFVNNTLALNGTIARNGPNGAGGNGGTGAPGTGLAAGCLPGQPGNAGTGGAGSNAGSAGGTNTSGPRGFSATAAAGGTAAGAGVAGNPGTAGGAGHGGGGGAGGNPGGAGFAGGAGGPITLSAATVGDVRAFPQATTARQLTNTQWMGATGGGGGGGGQTGGGGGGGVAGGWVVVCARRVTGTGAIEAKGGNGGNATGNGGGGGGGGGGVVVFVLGTGTFPTCTVTGGSGGNGGGTAPTGGVGGNGGAGITILFRVNA